MKYRCMEPLNSSGYYYCAGGTIINGVRYCSDYSVRCQIDYKGSVFCAYIGKKTDENQISFFNESEEK